MKISGLPELPDNCSLKFHANGVRVRVSLNIEKELIPLVPKGKLQRGSKFFVYWCAEEIPLIYSTPKNINMVYENLLNRAMRNVRQMKKEMLDSQIRVLKAKQIKIKF